jgi:hypothetical protein
MVIAVIAMPRTSHAQLDEVGFSGGGWIHTTPALTKATFGISGRVRVSPDSSVSISGQLVFMDRYAGFAAESTSITEVFIGCDGSFASVRGFADTTVGDEPLPFLVTVTGGSPGELNNFNIEVGELGSYVYVGTGPLGGGNIHSSGC